MKLSIPLQRKDPRLPVYVVIPNRHVQSWNLYGTTVIEGTANGFPIGRRTIKAWGKGTDDWFVEFTASFCKTANLHVGDIVSLDVEVADMSVPQELQDILLKSKCLEITWQALSESDRRVACEHIRAAKTQATRERRAAVLAEKLQGDATT